MHGTVIFQQFLHAHNERTGSIASEDKQNTAADETSKRGISAILSFEEAIVQCQTSAHILPNVSVSNTSTKTFTLHNAHT